MWPFKKKTQRTLDEYVPELDKIPRKCKRILRELERVAPAPINIKELAFACNLSPIEVGSFISSYPKFFKHVERIESKEYTKYRLDIIGKYTPAREEPHPSFRNFFLRITIRRK
jgi:hypothetical protein